MSQKFGSYMLNERAELYRNLTVLAAGIAIGEINWGFANQLFDINLRLSHLDLRAAECLGPSGNILVFNFCKQDIRGINLKAVR